uniref:Phospholipid/glycerol acyltransferase domain-containing protein n=1 Tax=Amazona collaria TaxID=241587 RepID=A0A8B9FT56_9PSIT
MEENTEGYGLAEGKILLIWTILFVVVLLPSVFRISLGISHFYVKILITMFEWATLKIEEGEDSFPHAGIIQRDKTSMEEELAGQRGGCFNLADVMYFFKKGCEAVAEDEVTQRFSSEELVSWNLLSRTNANLHHVSWHLTVVWVIGILIRYYVEMYVHFISFRVKHWVANQVQMICATLGVRCLSGLVHFHNRENRPQEGGICVANHTSPLDVLILASDGCYSLVGQTHGGFLGLIQKSCMQTTQHVLFERSEMKDRHLVRKKEHIADKAKLPILIFPEGTCINNTSVMMFKKGSFEVGGTIHPVAIKYDPRFGDAFWNSTKHSMMTYIFNTLSSWAIVCNVWYLPPMVKEVLMLSYALKMLVRCCLGGSLHYYGWDGGLKRKKVKESFKEEQQKKYCQLVIENGSVGNGNVC